MKNNQYKAYSVPNRVGDHIHLLNGEYSHQALIFNETYGHLIHLDLLTSSRKKICNINFVKVCGSMVILINKDPMLLVYDLNLPSCENILSPSRLIHKYQIDDFYCDNVSQCGDKILCTFAEHCLLIDNTGIKKIYHNFFRL